LDITGYKNTFQKEYIEKISKFVANNKAKKDGIGEAYENFRSTIPNTINKDLVIIPKKYHKKYLKEINLNSSFKPDQIITDKNGRILAIEEDKGHYVDKCFLERSLFGALKTIRRMRKSGFTEEQIPYFLLCSPTKYSKYDEEFKEILDIAHDMSGADSELEAIFLQKFVYFPMSMHDRVKKEEYDKIYDGSNPFVLSDELIQNEIDWFSNLI
jgi:hypothetical protein